MVQRDRLTASLRVEANDADPARLQAEINRRMAAALDRAKAVAAVSVATGSYSVYEEQAKAGTAARWHGQQSLSLSAHDAAPLLALAGALQQEGLALSSLGYVLTPEAARSVEDELTNEALSRLRDRAARIAGALGMEVERLRDVQVGNADGTAPMPLIRAGAMAAAPTPVAEPGDAVVSVSVSAEVLLAPRR